MEMEVGLIHTEILHTIVFQWEKQNGPWIEESFWDWKPIWHVFSSNPYILKKMHELP
jgi:hypothetical protein